ncbi:MAG: carbon storage regulator [Planctomycetota bacterium]|nr:carbon storage regulator [Planctomycetota bacterium]
MFNHVGLIEEAAGICRCRKRKQRRTPTNSYGEIKHGRVRLGFEAPGEIPIHRSEIWERIQRDDRPDETPLNSDESIVC